MQAIVSRMNHGHIVAGLRLSAQNGWNQLEADWRRQLDLEPEACFVAQADGQVVGTACACVFDTVAWVNLVLVDQAWRGRGIGTRLMQTVLEHLDGRGVPSIRLDATPLGQPIYEKLGFQVEYLLTRFGGTLRGEPQEERGRGGDGESGRQQEGEAAVRIAALGDLPGMVALDAEITSTARGKLLEYVMNQYADAFHVVRGSEGVIAFAGCRPGARAWQIGPCVGAGEFGSAACTDLLDAVAARLAGQMVFIDVPNDNPGATAWARAAGLTPQRPLTRMGRGPRVHERIERLWASFGPEKG